MVAPPPPRFRERQDAAIMKMRPPSTSFALSCQDPALPPPASVCSPDRDRGPVWILCATVLLAFIVACGRGGGSDPGSADGEVVVEHVTRIGDDSTGTIGGYVNLTKLRDGRYALFDMYFGGIVRFFGPDGSYVSTLGREGYGPGEFQQPWFQFIDATGDSLFVLDIALGRLSVFSPDGSVLHDTRLAGGARPIRVAFLDDGSFIANRVRLTPDGVGLPLHLVDSEGKLVYSFGTDFPVHLPGELLTHSRRFSPDEKGDLWVVPAYEYRIEHWRQTGDPEAPFVLDTVFEPSTVAFPSMAERESWPRNLEDGPPSPLVRGVWPEPDGPVWTIVSVPHEDWPDRYHPPPGPDLDAHFYSPENSYWKTRLDAFDPQTGRVLASREVDEMWFAFIGDGEAFSYGVTRAGIPYLDVWRVEFRSPQTEGG